MGVACNAARKRFAGFPPSPSVETYGNTREIEPLIY
jgi:hypothetical protein